MCCAMAAILLPPITLNECISCISAQAWSPECWALDSSAATGRINFGNWEVNHTPERIKAIKIGFLIRNLWAGAIAPNPATARERATAEQKREPQRLT
jgi:hypothetical protein